MRRALVLLARLLVGAVLLFSGGLKARVPHDTVLSVAGFHMLPLDLAFALGLLLPALEVVVGAALVTGVALRGAAFLALCLALTFAGAVGCAMSRHLDIACGCFGELPLSPRADLTTLSIDLALVLLALLILRGTRRASGTASAPGPAGAR